MTEASGGVPISRWRRRWISFWWTIYMPLDCIDLRTGLPDHYRLVSMGVGLMFAFKLVTTPGYPPVMVATLLVSAMFGVRVFKLFLVRSKLAATDTASTSTTTTITDTTTRTILDRRDPATAAEPS